MWRAKNQMLGKESQPDSPLSKTPRWCAAYTTPQGQRKHVDPSQLTLEQLSVSKLTPASSRAIKKRKKKVLFFFSFLSAAENKGFRNIAKTKRSLVTPYPPATHHWRCFAQVALGGQNEGAGVSQNPEKLGWGSHFDVWRLDLRTKRCATNKSDVWQSHRNRYRRRVQY